PVLRMLMVCCALWPPTAWLPKVRLAGSSDRPCTPEPEAEIASVGAPPPPTEMEVLAGPAAVGVNTTLMVHAAPAARLVPQLLDWVNAGAEDVIARLDTAAVPWLLTETVCADEGSPTVWLPKLIAALERVSPGAMPVADKASAWVPRLSWRASVAVSAPATDGVTATWKVQAAWAASDAVQVELETAKSPLLAAMVMPVRAAVPVLVS